MNSVSSDNIRRLRTYEAVWRELKNSKNHTAVLQIAHPFFVPRIKRMISKEKHMDLGFNILNELEKCVLKFEWNEERKELTIRLVGRFGIVDIKS